MHERVASLIYRCLQSNGGLYIKLGQALAMQADALPPVYARMFSRLFDEAPGVPWPVVRDLLEREFGHPVGDLFVSIDPQPTASASVAQVHRATVRQGGEIKEVAVKIQKPDIQKQVNWDLSAYSWLMYIYEKYVFDIPVYFTVAYTCERLRTELDFLNEAENSRLLMTALEADPEAQCLRDKVAVPRVYDELTTPRILTAEWIHGAKFHDFDAIDALGVSRKDIMDTVVRLFALQMFRFGIVHCDPHPGNMFVQRGPRGARIVLIDHGLYIRESESFRNEFSDLFTAIFQLDQATVCRIAEAWGIGQPDLLASGVLLRPYSIRRGGRPPPAVDEAKSESERQYEMQMAMKEQLKTMLKDQEKIPRELIFVGRNMRIVQSHNRRYGSPVNRITIMATIASRAQRIREDLTWPDRLRVYWAQTQFILTRGLLEVAFRLWQWGSALVYLRRGKGEHVVGFEDMLDRNMRSLAKENFGVDLSPDLFSETA